MRFNGTIIITDPCYVVKKDDWEKSYHGRKMNIFGISNYITESTLIGDWNCIVYETKQNPNYVIKIIVKANKYYYDNCENDINEIELDHLYNKYMHSVSECADNELGIFCADSGLVSVFYLDDILKYNPDFSKWADEHDWCVTEIQDFNGNIEYVIDSNGDAHIIGTGNINFFTIDN